MITRLSAGIVGLLAFAGMLLAGFLADNPFTTIILRALAGLAGGLLVGYLAGFVTGQLVTDRFRAAVEADADQELAAQPAVAAEDGAEASGSVAGMPSKETGQNGRSQPLESREQTMAVRAARQVTGH